LFYLLFILGTNLLLASCQFEKTSEDVFDNYLYRLSNSLKVDNDNDNNQSPINLKLYPKKSDMFYDIPSSNVNIWQFIQLSKCDLQRLIGHRNSSLGKLMTGYHSLLYEHQFLILAKRCLDMIEKGEPLYQELIKAIEHKKNYRDKLRWNAIFVSDEMRYLFSLSSQVLSDQQLSSNPVELVTALEYLNTWLVNPNADSKKLSLSYQTLTTRKYMGELRLTMSLAATALSQADNVIEQRLLQKPLCLHKKSNPQFEVVNRVFHKFYIGEVQPLLSKLYQQAHVLFNLFDQLQAASTPNEKFGEFWDTVYRSQNSEWNIFNKAISSHTKKWQDLLKSCGQLPS
jgi:hypothetical protein